MESLDWNQNPNFACHYTDGFWYHFPAWLLKQWVQFNYPVFISRKTWPTKTHSKWSMACNSGISPLHLSNLHSLGHYRIHLLSSSLLYEGCNDGSTVYLGYGLFYPHSCSNSGAPQNGFINFGRGDHQLCILVFIANNSCKSLPLPNFSMDGKAIQDAEKRRLASQWALLCRKILLSMNIIIVFCCKPSIAGHSFIIIVSVN